MDNLSSQFIDTLDEVYSRITSDVIEHAKKCFIDYLAVTLSGAKSLNSNLYELVRYNDGNSFVFGSEKRTETIYAILTNAYSAHVLELDDGHRAGMMHLAAPIFSAILPIAEQQNVTLENYLKAVIIGYEAAIRLAKTIQPEHKKRGFHCTGTCGTIGCAISIAYVLNYSKQEKLNVLSAACTSAAGLLEVIMGQSQQKPYNISHAALAGYTAATFGKYLVGPDDILYGKRGFINNFCESPKIEKLISKGKPEILGGYFKPYAACRHCHAPIEAALEIYAQGISSKEIKHVNIATYGLAVYGHEHTDVDSVNSAKMSTPFGVAIALLYGNAGMEMYTPSYIEDKAVKVMMSKISIYEEAEMSALVPDKRVASIEVLLHDGNVLEYRVDYPLGEPENPISLDAIFSKFDSLLQATQYDKNYVDELHKYLSAINGKTTISEIIQKF